MATLVLTLFFSWMVMETILNKVSLIMLPKVKPYGIAVLVCFMVPHTASLETTVSLMAALRWLKPKINTH
jgi:hypothetical protein